tara:strand:+ start:411 stop:608 length:198 start_codon:yes stop_codon:yes gene_type:complete
MKSLIEGPNTTINPAKMKNLNDLPRKLARTNKGKLIPKTPAEIVNTLYGIGVSPAKNTAKNPQEL